MVHDINQYGLYREHKSQSQLNAMTKAELIKYIRILEHDYNGAVDFNEQQARNIEQMIKDGRLTEVIMCKDCDHYDTYGFRSKGTGWCEVNEVGRFDNGYCHLAKLKELEGDKNGLD